MQHKESPLSRLRGKGGRERLAELYGKARAGAEQARYEELAAALQAGTDEGEARFYSAPGRTELGGNHTDHNRGRVLCAAVTLDAVACAVPSEDLVARIVSAGWPDPIVVDLADLEPRAGEAGRTEALVRGVARGLADKGVPPRGFRATMHSTVLPGSGLSSSAAVELLFATLLSDLAGAELPPLELARIGQFAENAYFGKPCGLMDQAASATGGIVAIDFASTEKPRVKRVDFDFEEEGYVLAVVATGGSHADLTDDYAAIPAEMRAVAAFLGATALRDVDPDLLVARGPEIRAACGDRALLRAFHFAAENARVVDMEAALRGGALRKYLKLVKKSGDSSWRLLQNLYPASAPREQGLCLALALTADFLGKKGAWRVHGGGFAGTVQAYVPKALFQGYAALMERYFGEGAVLPLPVRHAGALRVF